MNERTNITDKGYSYGGKDYVYETRTNPTTNTPYQVAIEKTASTPTMQTTTAQRQADVKTQMKFDELASSKGMTTPSTPAGWGSAVYGDPTKPSTITGYDNPEAKALETKTVETVQPWTPAKDDTPEMTAAKNSYKLEQEKRDKQLTEIETTFNELKANSPIENQLVMDKIKAKYAKTKAILDQNMSNLAGLHEKQGYATGGITKGGATLVGEKGPELVDLPRGSRVWDHGQSMGKLGSDTGQTMTIILKNEGTLQASRQVIDDIAIALQKRLNLQGNRVVFAS